MKQYSDLTEDQKKIFDKVEYSVIHHKEYSIKDILTAVGVFMNKWKSSKH